MDDKLKELHALCKPAAEAMSDSERLTRLVQLYPEVIEMAVAKERENIASQLRDALMGEVYIEDNYIALSARMVLLYKTLAKPDTKNDV